MLNKFQEILFGIICLVLVVTIFMYALFDIRDNIELELMKQNCCDGMMCSDTYYTPIDNTCHLVLCEQKSWLGMSNCTYLGKNITINFTGEIR